MGVTRRNIFDRQSVIFEEDLLIASDVEPDASNVNTPTKSVKKNVRKKNPASPMNYAKTSGRKAKGCRASRRYENLHYLLSMTENEEFGELDITDFVEPSRSVFGSLLVEQEKMQIWNEFINQSEEEQERLLTKSKGLKASQKGAEPVHNETLASWDLLPDFREAHPAYSAKECFQRIDSNLKGVLRRGQFPKGTLVNMEEELISMFVECSNSVLVYRLNSSYERLLLHALCQYMDLTSHSYYSDQVRHTQVENRNAHFVLPDSPLSSYLEIRRKVTSKTKL